jgi:hypothetical protein
VWAWKDFVHVLAGWLTGGLLAVAWWFLRANGVTLERGLTQCSGTLVIGQARHSTSIWPYSIDDAKKYLRYTSVLTDRSELFTALDRNRLGALGTVDIHRPRHSSLPTLFCGEATNVCEEFLKPCCLRVKRTVVLLFEGVSATAEGDSMGPAHFDRVSRVAAGLFPMWMQSVCSKIPVL